MNNHDGQEGVTHPLFQKGLEEEVFTGTAAGEIIGFSPQVMAARQGYSQEPDARNVEYITSPTQSYSEMIAGLLERRRTLRSFLRELGNYTLVAGSTLSLGDSTTFFSTHPENRYYCFIENSYGTRVVTTSLHINLGIEDSSLLFRAHRIMRLEASLFLALSACSPFLDGELTGFHSTRWNMFPKTPSSVPLFKDYEHYCGWIKDKLVRGEMHNSRHLWVSARPNGDQVPISLNRLELRICDRVDDPMKIMALVALFETRVLQIAADPNLNPPDDPALIHLAQANENNVARDGLSAKVVDWRTRKEWTARKWVNSYVEALEPLARRLGLYTYFFPIYAILERGNTAEAWIQSIQRGKSPREIIMCATEEMNEFEKIADSRCEEK